jgi:hypothetical protein
MNRNVRVELSLGPKAGGLNVKAWNVERPPSSGLSPCPLTSYCHRNRNQEVWAPLEKGLLLLPTHACPNYSSRTHGSAHLLSSSLCTIPPFCLKFHPPLSLLLFACMHVNIVQLVHAPPISNRLFFLVLACTHCLAAF